jgi:hypothetical protein
MGELLASRSDGKIFGFWKAGIISENIKHEITIETEFFGKTRFLTGAICITRQKGTVKLKMKKS